MNISLSSSQFWERVPSLEEVQAEIRQREARRNADSIRASQTGRGGLLKFVEYFWPVLEPQTQFVNGWPLQAICAHLEAVTFGDINRLLMNVPPGFMKSLLTDVFWPAFEWGPMNMPHLRYVAFSYSASLTERDNRRFKDLIMSPEYQLLWGDRFNLRKQGETLVSNDKTGWKLATSVGGVGTGERGDRAIIDDAHNVKEAESDTVRGDTVRWFEEAAENRVNDLKKSAIIVIGQRVHELDVCGAIIKAGGYEHLMIPMEFEPGRSTKTKIGWRDPRRVDGELAWASRFAEKEIQTFKRRAYMWAGQYQQRPEPRGGGIFKRDWWKPWHDGTAKTFGVSEGCYPAFSFTLAVLDTAYTEKEENDPCAMTVWGLWHDMRGNPQVMLVHAWEEWLEFNPLVEKTVEACKKFKADWLLIEAKASGISVGQELTRRYAGQGFGVGLVDPGKGDKVARAYAVTHLFEDEMVWAPAYCNDKKEFIGWRKWAERVIDQCAIAGTMIITTNGLVPIEEIKVGDLVLTHAGRFRAVLRTSRRMADSVVRLEAKSLDAITVTPNHPVYALDLQCDRSVRNGDAAKWVHACDVRPRAYRKSVRNGREVMEAHASACHALTLPVMKPDNAVKEIDLREWISPPPNRKIKIVSDDEFIRVTSNRTAPIKWRQPLDRAFGRVVGLYLAEGSGRRGQLRWSFNVKETHLVEEVVRFIKDRLGRTSGSYTQNNATTVYANLAIIESLFAQCGRGAANKRIPNWAWDAPDEFVHGLLDGYMDGDGTRYANEVRGTTVSASLAWGIRLLALRIGINATVRVTRLPRQTKIMGRACSTRAAYAVSWRRDRKNDGVAKIVGNVAGYSVMKTTALSGVEVFNMDVAEDNSYCTTGGIVHNCATFPKSTNDDLTDTMTMALKHLRDRGLLLRAEEHQRDVAEQMAYRRDPKPLYQG